MELNWLKYFFETARNGSVSRAANHLRISQPAVSKIIQKLEDQIGYSLFVRTGRGLRLSAKGQLLYQRLIPLFHQLGELNQLEAGPLSAATEGIIRVGASDVICNYWLPKIVAQFSKQFPNVSFELFSGTSNAIQAEISAGKLQFGLFFTALSRASSKELSERVLTEVDFQIAYPARLGKLKNITELNRKRLLYIGARGFDYPQSLPEQIMVLKSGLEIERTLESNSKETQKKLVEQGVGFAIFPSVMIREEIEKGTLMAFRSAQRFPVRLVTRKGESLLAVQEEFAQCFVNAAKLLNG